MSDTSGDFPQEKEFYEEEESESENSTGMLPYIFTIYRVVHIVP